MLKRNFDVSPWVTENTCSVHLYGRRMRTRATREARESPPFHILGAPPARGLRHTEYLDLPAPEGESFNMVNLTF